MKRSEKQTKELEILCVEWTAQLLNSSRMREFESFTKIRQNKWMIPEIYPLTSEYRVICRKMISNWAKKRMSAINSIIGPSQTLRQGSIWNRTLI